MTDDTQPLQPATARVRSLDGLRGVAVSLVILTHCFRPAAGGSVIATALHNLVVSMWLGVDLFFVLSGYLITRILLSARDKPHYFRNFYMRRVARIWPAFYLVLAYVLLVAPLIDGLPWDRTQQALLPWFLLQVQNWAIVLHSPEFPWSWNVTHLWSLGVEEQFYFAWPLLILLVPRTRLFVVCVGLFWLSLVVRLALVANHAPWMSFYAMPLSHMDGLAAGAALAIFIEQNGFANAIHRARLILAERIGWIVLLLLLVVCGGIDGRPPWVMALAITAASLAFTGVVFRIHFSSLSPRVERALNHAALVWLGKYSYGIYLIHFVLLADVMRVLGPRLPPFIANHGNLQVLVIGSTVTALSLVWAWLMFRFVESPALRWGARYSSHPPPANQAMAVSQ